MSEFPSVTKLREIINERVETHRSTQQENGKLFVEKMNRACDIYYERVLKNIYNAIDYMQTNERGFSCVYVNVPTSRVEWLTDKEMESVDPENDDEEEKKFIPWHWIHYGFPNRQSRKKK